MNRGVVTEWLGFTESVESPYSLHYAGPKRRRGRSRGPGTWANARVGGDMVGSGRAVSKRLSATAAAAFEDSGATSIAGVLTSGDPSVVLQQGSLLMELSGNRSAQTRQLLADASQLAGVEQEMSRTEAGIVDLKHQLAGHRSSLGKLIDTQKATLASLTVPQRQAVTDNAIGANGSSAPQQYTGPTSTQ